MLSEMSHYPNARFIGLANRSSRGRETVLKVLFLDTSADPPRAAISSETMRAGLAPIGTSHLFWLGRDAIS
jgi:hypothetical protein